MMAFPGIIDEKNNIFKPIFIVNSDMLNKTTTAWSTTEGVPHSSEAITVSDVSATLMNCSVENCTLNDTANGTGLVSNGAPEPLPDYAQALIITFYTLAIFLAAFGNILAIIIFSTGRRSRGDLRTYLLNLALADLAMCVFCIPFTFPNIMYHYWQFGGALCTIVVFMQLVTVTVSVSTNMAIGIDRFLAVSFPLKSRASRKPVIKRIVVIIIWCLSILLASPNLKVAQTVPIPGYPQYYQCTEKWPGGKRPKMIFGIFILIFTYIVPLVMLLVTYGIIATKLWRRQAPGEANQARDMAQLQSKRKVIKMLVTIVVLFGVCWLPLHTFINVLDFYPDLAKNANQAHLEIIYICFHWLAMSNSFQNPIIYGFLNDSFRADFWDLVFVCLPCCTTMKYFKNHRRMSYTSRGASRWQQSSFSHFDRQRQNEQPRSLRNGSTSSSSDTDKHTKFNSFARSKTDTQLLYVPSKNRNFNSNGTKRLEQQPLTLVIPPKSAQQKSYEMEKLLEASESETTEKRGNVN